MSILRFSFSFSFPSSFEIFYLRQRESTAEGGAEVEGQADSSLGREPYAGLPPRTLGSSHERKVDALADAATQALPQTTHPPAFFW